ncbi:MAG TPA: class I SAM-dependent methyltransferase [Gammaproteobacteria bacterium]|nr:class I SAM-dependent methyltransferase [Gammaproteobacteria bacterium]
MTEFEKTLWADSEFAQNYRDDANIYLPFRSQFIELAKSIFDYFVKDASRARILDLGCGDAIFVQELLKKYSPSRISLVDGSKEMLQAARKRLGENEKISFIKASFQDLLRGEILNENFDFVYSSLAIHHLPFDEKKELYSYIFKRLSSGGYFVLYDVVLPATENIEKYHLALWKKWIKEHPSKEQAQKLLDIPEQYKANSDNIPDTLSSQLQILEEIGFKDVSCHFKYGIFALFGGLKHKQ